MCAGTGQGLTASKLYQKFKTEEAYLNTAQARQLRATIFALPALHASPSSSASASAAAVATTSVGAVPARIFNAFEHVLCCRVVDREHLSQTGVEGQYECDPYPAEYAVVPGTELL